MDERPGDGNALSLATRELMRPVVHAFSQTELGEQFADSIVRFLARFRVEVGSHLNALEDGEGGK